MEHLIVGFSGYARSGKDYSSEKLYQNAWNFGIHARMYALASPIKTHCNSMFGWGEEHSDGDLKEVDDPFWGFSPRHAYQTFGTEWARNTLGEDIWIKFMERQHCMLKQDAVRQQRDSLFIITDVRFPNEVKAIKEKNGLIISVVNEATEAEVMPHSSEAHIKDIRNQANFVIENNYKVDPEGAEESLNTAIGRVLAY
jgi:hypothetical protein